MSPNLLGKLSGEKKKSSSKSSWIGNNWETVACLLGIFVVALMVRAYFAFETATEYGLPYLLGGGADSHYNARIVDYIVENGEHLFSEPMRGYPLEGHQNTRPPLYQWSVVVGGYILAPLAGSVERGVNLSFIFSAAFWGAMTTIPTYLLGKKTFGKKAGIAAAFLLAISAAHLERGVITNTNHDAFSMFLIVSAFYLFMRSLEEIKAGEKWVSDWKKGNEIKKGIYSYFRQNKKSVLYSLLTGILIGALALTWKGWPYVMVIMLVYFLIQLVIDKFRRRDSLGITINIFAIFMVAFLMALPWYGAFSSRVLSISQWFSWPLGGWYQIPFVIFLGTFGVGVYFTVTRDLPWLLTFGSIGIVGGIFIAVFPEFFMEAAGAYFVDNKMYQTIAEAQAPGFSRLVLAGGLATFFLSWTGIGFAIWHLRKEWNRSFIFILVWTAFAIYMATVAARFVFNAAPAFALTAGWVVALIFDKTKFKEIARTFKSYRGDKLRGIKEGVQIKHVIVTLLVVFVLLTPNAMYAIDAGIPFEEKDRFNEQIHEALPSFLRPPEDEEDAEEAEEAEGVEAQQHYLGAFGYSLDKPTDYWPTAWEDINEQNEGIPPEERPAFVSWWDYGFEAMNQGEIPTVADNFQHGYHFAANFLMSQSENEMMALLIGRQLQHPYSEEGEFNETVREILEEELIENSDVEWENYLVKEDNIVDELENTFKNREQYRDEVLNNPEKYHPRADDIESPNLRWAVIMGVLSEADLDTLSSLYRRISFESGYERLENRMGYFAVDSRMFPTDAQRTGIFHAPAFLGGFRVEEEVGRTPIDFYTMEFIDQEGVAYEDPDEIPPDAQIVDQRINFQPMFYNSTLYRIFAGYSLQEVDMDEEDMGMDPGLDMPGMETPDEGVPGIDDPQSYPMPGWNLRHFDEVHRTAYYNPYPEDEVENHTDAWEAIPYSEAIELDDDENVTVDLSPRSYMGQGVSFLRYYDGAILEGQLRTEEGQPISDAKITVLDTNPEGATPRDGGTPRDTTRTDEEGNFEVVLPEGDISVVASTGGSPNEHLIEDIELAGEEFEITEEQALRKENYSLDKDLEVESSNVTGKVFLDSEGDGVFDEAEDELVKNGGEVYLENEQFNLKYTGEIDEGNYAIEEVVPGTYKVSSSIPEAPTYEGVEINPGENVTQDIAIGSRNVTGTITLEDDNLEGEEMTLRVDGTDRSAEVILGETRQFNITNVPPGEYELKIEEDHITTKYGPVDLNLLEEETIHRDLTIVEGNLVEGVAMRDGESLSNQTLKIHGHEYNRAITTNESGEFKISIPDGVYQFYGINKEGEETTAHLQKLTLSSDTDHEANFEEAHKLNGSLEFEEEYADRAEIFFRDSDGAEHYAVTNDEGGFKTHLPENEYQIYGWRMFDPGQEDEIGHHLYFLDSEIELEGDKEESLEGEIAVPESGTISRELLAGAEYDPDEDMGLYTNFTVKFNNRSIERNTQFDGEYRIYIPEKECTFVAEKEGYEPKTVTFDPSEEESELGDLQLRAENITAEGSIDFHREPVEEIEDMVLTFEPLGNGAVEKETYIEDQTYEVDLQPGEYEVTADYDELGDNKTYQISDSLSIEVGQEDIEKELTAHYREKLSGDIILPEEVETGDIEISFQGPEERKITTNTSSYEIYLIPGDYSVRAVYEEEELGAQLEIEFDQSKERDIELKDTYSLEEEDVRIELPEDFDRPTLTEHEIPVEFENKETGYVIETTTSIDGELDLNLVDGEYNITVDHKIHEVVEGEVREVRYFLSETRSTPISENLELDWELLNATLTGEIEEVGAGVEVIIRDENSELVKEDLQTNESGEFMIDELMHGEYTLYISTEIDDQKYSHFETFEMPTDNEHLEITLEESYIFSGTVQAEGDVEPDDNKTDLEISRDGARNIFRTQEDDTFEIVLPKGNYTIEISDERKNEYGLLAEYSRHHEIEINEDTKDYEIELYRDEESEVQLKLEEKTVSQGEKIEDYTIQIENTGKFEDIYNISVYRTDWEVSFDRNTTEELVPDEASDIELDIEVGENATVGESVEIQIKSRSEDEFIKEENIELEIKSDSEYESVEEVETPIELPIEVEQKYGLAISEEYVPGTFNSGEVTYSIGIENLGNGPDEYHIEITNEEEIKDHGWNVTELEIIGEISAYDTVNETIELRSLQADRNGEIPIDVEVTSEGDGSVTQSSFEFKLPELRGDEDTVEFESEEFKLEDEPLTLSTWHWTGIVILVVIGAGYIMRKKRWI